MPRARPPRSTPRAGRSRPEPAAAKRRGPGQAAASAPPAARRGAAPEAAAGTEISPRRLPVPPLTTAAAEPQLRALRRHRHRSDPAADPRSAPARRLPGPARPCGTTRSAELRPAPPPAAIGRVWLWQPRVHPVFPRSRRGGSGEAVSPHVLHLFSAVAALDGGGTQRLMAERAGQCHPHSARTSPRERPAQPGASRIPIASAQAVPYHRTPPRHADSPQRREFRPGVTRGSHPAVPHSACRLSPNTACWSAAPPTVASQWGREERGDVYAISRTLLHQWPCISHAGSLPWQVTGCPDTSHGPWARGVPARQPHRGGPRPRPDLSRPSPVPLRRAVPPTCRSAAASGSATCT